MSMPEKANQLAEYVVQLRREGFEYSSAIDGNYHHMGATLTDAILQAGLNYKSTVEPRVRAIRVGHPEARTTSGFRDLLAQVGAKQLLAPWTGDEKPNRLVGLTQFLCDEAVETEEDLCTWLDSQENAKRLRRLRGVGPKTLRYIGILVGRDDVAVDVHIKRFLRRAAVDFSSEEEAHDIVCLAADELGVRRSVLDHSIWLFMSKKTGK